MINLANYCGGEEIILPPPRFKHCGDERPRCPRGSDAFGHDWSTIMRSADHVTDQLARRHCLRVSQRIKYKITELMFEVLLKSVPPYLGPRVPVADRPIEGHFALLVYQSSAGATCRTFNDQ